MKAKKLHAWMVVDDNGDGKALMWHRHNAFAFAAERNPKRHVVKLTGTFTPPKRAAVRGRK